MIYGVGIDLVMTSRIEEALRRWGERFREKVFTPGEIQYCLHKRNPAPSFSARFAAKEAFSKALGVGMRWGVHWKDVEVKRGPLGKPVLQLHGRAKELCRSENIQGIFLSLTHDRTFSSAMVVLERNSQ
jgi:holo-[acyl-carrier protein] synthase